jgi:bacillolysin
MKSVSSRLLIAGLLLLIPLIIPFSQPAKRGNPPGVPPLQSLKAYALSNAPTVASGTAWSTNAPDDPRAAQLIKNLPARLPTSPASQPTATPSRALEVPFRSASQRDAFDRLQQTTGGPLQVYLRPDNTTPAQIKGYPLMKAVAGLGDLSVQQERTARTFLQENASLLLLHDPATELRLLARETDELGRTHLHFTQHYAGLKVWPDQLSVHLDPEGNVDLMDGAYIPTPEGTATKPQLSGEEAEATARASLAGGAEGTATKPELVIYGPMDKPPRLGWKIELASGLRYDWLTVIDAITGSPLTAYNQVMEANVVGSGTDLLGATRALNVWQSGSTYYLWDTSKNMFKPATWNGALYTLDVRSTPYDQLSGSALSDVTSANPNSWNNPDAVSAAYNFSETYDYYHQKFGRDSYNGQGSNMTAVVRVSNYPNASWHKDIQMMLFGSSDRYAASLDVIGHELTHGVSSSIAGNTGLQYHDQPGALNEAFSDIFGEMIEARTKGTNDWIIGSQLATPVRDMANPGNYGQPSKMSQFVMTTNDNGGVHSNSGIINRAYFLLAAGLRGATGNTNAERIFYRCLTQNTQPESQFIDCRLGCIAAAEALFGTNSVQAIKTAEAFDCVELYAAPASTVQPSTTSAAVAAPDSYMWLRYAWDWGSLGYLNCLYRYEAAQSDSGSGTKLVTNTKVSRPSVAGNGYDMYFVGADDGLCYMLTTGSGFSTSNSGQVHSIALSPDRRYAAFVLNASVGNPTNQLYLYDSVSNTVATIALKTPVQDGPPLNNIRYADALDFSPDGKTLIYDALSSIKMPDNTLRQVWSIFALSTVTLQQSVVVPPVADFQIGSPFFSQTSSRYIVFDAQYTNGSSGIVTLDLFLGNGGVVGVSQTGLGYPCFNGDDSTVLFADADGTVNSGRSVYQQALSADKLSASGSRALWISDAKLATVYRRGTYVTPYTAPAIALTSPSQNAVYNSLGNVTLAATATSPNGSVARVEFYVGSKLIGTDTSAPYSFVWTTVPAGNYRAYARVYDITGAAATSAPVDFTVRPPARAGDFTQSGPPGFEFSLRIPQAGLYRLECSTNLVNWMPLGSYLCTTNLCFFDAGATNWPKRFYRAVSTP